MENNIWIVRLQKYFKTANQLKRNFNKFNIICIIMIICIVIIMCKLREILVVILITRMPFLLAFTSRKAYAIPIFILLIATASLFCYFAVCSKAVTPTTSMEYFCCCSVWLHKVSLLSHSLFATIYFAFSVAYSKLKLFSLLFDVT